jgi:hypothetical protein
MKTSLDDHLRKVTDDGESLARLADRAAQIAKGLGLDGRVKAAQELAARARDRSFQIIFAGEFNSGKSTAINALLGEAVMPMKVVEANAILTKIRYGPEKRAVLHAADGGSLKEVPYGDFAKYIVVDRKDRKKPSQWKFAELFYPLDVLRQGIVIVDPPGLNALPERQLLTVEETGKSDAAVFLFFAGQSFKESERSFIIGCLDSKEAFWLVTHADSLNGAETSDVREDLESQLRMARRYDETITSRIFFVDARRAQEAAACQDDDGFAASGMKEFLRVLGDFVAGDRHRAKMQDLCARLNETLNILDQAAESQLHDTQRGHEEVVKRHEKLKTELDAAGKDADNAVERLTSRLFPLAGSVRRMVRSKVRAIPGDPPFKISDLEIGDLTFWMDIGFDQDKKQYFIDDVRSQVVRRIQEDLRDWFRHEVQSEVRSELDTELNIFNKTRKMFEMRLASIRFEYLGLPQTRRGYEPSVPNLEAGRFTDVTASTVRSVTGALQVPTRAMRRSFDALLMNPWSWSGAKAKAAEEFADTISRIVVEQVAEMADDLADTAKDEMLAWFRKVETAARKSISDPQIDLESAAQEGERTSSLEASEKENRRDQLAAHLAQIATLQNELARLQAQYGTH